jgi:hypothetical protein
MKRIHLAMVCAAIVLCLSTSCQKGLRIRVVNNTGTAMTVTAFWSHGDSSQRNLKQGGTATFDWPLSMSAQSGTNTWSYSPFPRLTSGFLESRTFGYRLSVQIQDDGSLYVIPGAATGVVTNYGFQPPGFPLKPQK